MARNATLSSLLVAYRSECRLSLNPSQNVQVRETQIAALVNTQKWLWEEFDWPHLRASRLYPLAAGQKLYDFSADFDMERIDSVEVKEDGIFKTLRAGIGAEHYAAHDSDLGARSWPPQNWRIAENDEVELWPIPDTNGRPVDQHAYLRVTGIRRLRPLVADADKADLDDRLIVLYAAAEYLASTGAKDAKLKLDKANSLYGRLRGGLTKTTEFSMFGVGRQTMPRRPVVTNYRRPGN